jgi:twitching motility protein PilT
MDILNEYLKRLLSSCSDELRLEPDKNPYLVSENHNTDVGNVPLMGTQISSIVFPLIPPGVKSTLPNRSEVEFVHPHNLGNFNFNVQKSSAGFIVTIRPLLTDANGMIDAPRPVPDAVPTFSETPAFEEPAPYQQPVVETSAYEPASEPAQSYDLESSSYSFEATAAEAAENAKLEQVVYEDDTAQEYISEPDIPQIEVISFNDPEYQTVFSDTSTYEPPGRRDDFALGDYAPATQAAPEYSSDEAYVPPPVETQPHEFYNAPTPVTPSEPVEAPFVPVAADSRQVARMDALFHKMAELGASDLHLSVSMPPMVRKDGKICKLEANGEVLTPDTMRELLTSIMPRKNQEEFAERSDSDFAYEILGLARFRCNIFMDRKGMGAVFRIIPSKILTAEQLGLSKAIMDLTALSKGLVVVTGPTGSGKSTTLCAMVDSINKNREDHIITIEDPIEFTHENQKCLVNQREVHNHTDSFKDALRAALREDPDILLVGEMRDLETISIAIETAETGHLVFGTLHTTTAASTVDRIIDQFPADRQQQIRVMLSESLKGVIAQTLLPKKGGGRVAALEVLIVTPAISNLIREGKTFQIPSAMQTGKNLGMVMLNDALFALVEKGLVEPLDAYVKAVDKTGFEALLTRGGFKL